MGHYNHSLNNTYGVVSMMMSPKKFWIYVDHFGSKIVAQLNVSTYKHYLARRGAYLI